MISSSQDIERETEIRNLIKAFDQLMDESLRLVENDRPFNEVSDVYRMAVDTKNAIYRTQGIDVRELKDPRKIEEEIKRNSLASDICSRYNHYVEYLRSEIKEKYPEYKPR